MHEYTHRRGRGNRLRKRGGGEGQWSQVVSGRGALSDK